MDNEIKWLWKTTQTEAFYATYTISYRLTLATREPLLEDHLLQALTHLFRYELHSTLTSLFLWITVC